MIEEKHYVKQKIVFFCTRVNNQSISVTIFGGKGLLCIQKKKKALGYNIAIFRVIQLLGEIKGDFVFIIILPVL